MILAGSLLAAAPKETAPKSAVRKAAALKSAAQKDAAPARNPDEDAIRAVAKQYMAAVAQGDLKAATSFWVPGGDIVDTSRRSRPASEVLAEELKATSPGPRMTLNVTNSSIRVLTTDSAIEDGTSEVTRPGLTAPLQGHFSAVWVKQQGKWRLASLRETRSETAASDSSAADATAALDILTGHWTAQVGDKTFAISAAWNPTHTFLVRELKVSAKGGLLQSASEQIGWDPATHHVRSWMFDSDGGHAEGVWTLEGNAWIVQAATTLADGKRMTSTNIVSLEGHDALVWKLTNGRRNGKVMNDVEIKLTRGSAQAQATAPALPAATAGKSSDDAKKSALLNSPRWRRAMFEMDEWLSAQPIYTKQQVAQMKADLMTRVAKMSSSELEFTLSDMDAKFKMLDSKDAQETRAWLAQYLSLLSDKRREEIIKRLPNLATMSSAQLSEELAEINQKRATQDRERADLNQYQPPTTDPWDPGSKAAMQAYLRDHGPEAGQYVSPYRAAPYSKPFADAALDSQSMSYYVTPLGGVGLFYTPGSPLSP
jgi:uncharacterized protein (TIGR02246 family)